VAGVAPDRPLVDTQPVRELDPDGGLVNLFTPVTPEAKAKYGL